MMRSPITPKQPLRILVLTVALAATLAYVAPAAAQAPVTPPAPLGGRDVAAPSFGGIATIPVEVPDNMSADRLQGYLELTAPAGVGNVLVRVDSVLVQAIPATSLVPGRQPFVVDLGGLSPDDNVVTVEIENLLRAPGNGEVCGPQVSPNLVLTDLSVSLGGTPRPPASVAEFFGPGVSEYVISTGQTPTTAEAHAALELVSALSVGVSPKVSLVTGPIASSTFKRVITISETGTDPSVAITGPGTLQITGPADQLPAAALASVPPSSVIATSVTASPAQVVAPVPSPELVLDLEQLAGGPVQLRGVGTLRRDIPISQAAFSTPVSEMVIDVSFTHTPMLTNQSGSLSLLWNGTLVRSANLSNSVGLVDFQLPLAGRAVQRDNTLTVVTEVSAPGGGCGGDAVPAIVQMAPASTVSAVAGDDLPAGFRRWPQVATSGLDVAFTDEADGKVPAEHLAAAGEVLAQISEISAEPIPVDLVSFATLRNSSSPGFVVGVDESTQAGLDLPMPYGRIRQTDVRGTNVAFGVDQPYASLQSYKRSGQDMLVLGSYDNAQLSSVPAALAERVGGFGSLTGQLMLVTADGQEADVTSLTDTAERNAFRPVAESALNPGVALIALAVAALVLYVVYRYLRARAVISRQAREERALNRQKAAAAAFNDTDDTDTGTDDTDTERSHEQSAEVANSDQATDDQAFIDAVSQEGDDDDVDAV
jgi:hypothetical protein